MKFTLVALFLSLLIGCSPSGRDELEKVYNSCTITKYYLQGDTSNLVTYFHHDAQGRLSRIDFPNDIPLIINYSPTRITYVNGIDSNIYIIGPDLKVMSSDRYVLGDYSSTTTYHYNSNGELFKEVRNSIHFGKDSTLLTYQNGNLVNMKNWTENGFFTEANYEYYTDLEAKSWYYSTMILYDMYRMPWVGALNKNLLKRQTGNISGTPYNISYNYELNASGYVKSFTQVEPAGTSKHFMEYQCQ